MTSEAVPLRPDDLHRGVVVEIVVLQLWQRQLNLQSDQLNIAVFFWYFVKLFSSSVCRLLYSSVTFYKVTEKHGHV